MCVLLMHRCHSAQMLFSRCARQQILFFFRPVVTAPLSPSKKQSSSWSSHVADLVDLRTLRSISVIFILRTVLYTGDLLNLELKGGLLRVFETLWDAVDLTDRCVTLFF